MRCSFALGSLLVVKADATVAAISFAAFQTTDDLFAVFAGLFAFLLHFRLITFDFIRRSIRVTELLLRLDVISQPLLEYLGS